MVIRWSLDGLVDIAFGLFGQHQNPIQVSTLREEIESKQTMIEELRDANQKLTLAQEKMIGDYEKLKREEEEKSAKLADITVANERREQAKQDLKGIWKMPSSLCSRLRSKCFIFMTAGGG